MSGAYRDGKLHLHVRKRELAEDSTRVTNEIAAVDARLGRTRARDLLDRCRSAAPCGVQRNGGSSGDDRKRSCGACGNTLYDLYGLTPTEEELLLEAALVDSPERLFRRLDGTIMTFDCGKRIRRNHRAMLAGVVGTLIAMWLFAEAIRPPTCASDTSAVKVSAPIGANADRVGASQAVYK